MTKLKKIKLFARSNLRKNAFLYSNQAIKKEADSKNYKTL